MGTIVAAKFDCDDTSANLLRTPSIIANSSGYPFLVEGLDDARFLGRLFPNTTDLMSVIGGMSRGLGGTLHIRAMPNSASGSFFLQEVKV